MKYSVVHVAHKPTMSESSEKFINDFSWSFTILTVKSVEIVHTKVEVLVLSFFVRHVELDQIQPAHTTSRQIAIDRVSNLSSILGDTMTLELKLRHKFNATVNAH